MDSDSDLVKMFISELDSFIWKFHQLRQAGVTAHLDVDTHAGQAWVGLRVMLGSVQNQQFQYHHQGSSSRHRSPSYFRRQERRNAAKQTKTTEEAAEEASEDNNKASEKKEEAVVEATPENHAAPVSFDCELCDFTSNRVTGLRIHMTKMHATIEQLDGNTTLPLTDGGNIVEEEFDHYLQTGIMRNPAVRAENGQQLWLWISAQIDRCKFNNILSKEDREEEMKQLRQNDLSYHPP